MSEPIPWQEFCRSLTGSSLNSFNNANTWKSSKLDMVGRKYWLYVAVIAIRHIIMRRNTSKFGALEATRRVPVLDQVTFLKESRGRMDDIDTFLNHITVIVLVADADPIQSRGLE